MACTVLNVSSLVTARSTSCLVSYFVHGTLYRHFTEGHCNDLVDVTQDVFDISNETYHNTWWNCVTCVIYFELSNYEYIM
jgi:hypothetical protein